MSDSSQPDVRTRIREEAAEITQEFEGRIDPETLARCVDTAQGLVADSRIQDFAPIFFSRHARRLIREATSEIPPRSDAG
jgi:hypothetical protein